MAAGTVAAFDVGEDAPPGRPLQPLLSSASPVSADAVRSSVQKTGRTLPSRCCVQRVQDICVRLFHILSLASVHPALLRACSSLSPLLPLIMHTCTLCRTRRGYRAAGSCFHPDYFAACFAVSVLHAPIICQYPSTIPLLMCAWHSAG